MTDNELRKHITSVPFRPFNILMVTGHRIPVKHRDFILITPSRTHTYVFQPDDSSVVLDIALIAGVEFDATVTLTPSELTK